MKIKFQILICLFLGCAGSPPQLSPPATEQMRVSGAPPSKVHVPNGIVTLTEIGLYINDNLTHKIEHTTDSCNSCPTLKDTVLSDYPAIARVLGKEGKIKVIAWIDTSGKIIKTKVETSDAEMFVKAALDAVQKCSYVPYRVNCRPREFVSLLTFDYRLGRHN